ncbi:MAG: hypothetical protein GY928_35590, partial [Colwellia sp.]|nr:hypothetical protein [Colwellia sp.]
MILEIYNAGRAAFFKFIKALPAEKLAPMLNNMHTIIQTRQSTEKQKSESITKLNTLPSDLQRHIASFSDAKSYFRLSLGNRLLYLALHRTITLTEITVPNVIPTFDLGKYTLLRKLNLSCHQIRRLQKGQNLDRITHLCLNASDWTYTGEVSVNIIFELIRKCVALTSLSIYYPMNIRVTGFGFDMPPQIRCLSIYKTPHQVKKTLLQLYSEQLVEINIHCAYQPLSLDSWVQFSNLTTLRLFEFQTVNNQ